MSTYHIEHAKSGRASCKKCKGKLEKGELRIGISSMREDYSMTSYQHPKCFTIPRKLGVDAESFVMDHLEDQTDDSVLSTSQKDEIVNDIASKAVTAKGEASDGNAISKKMDTLKRTLAENEDEPPKKKAKKGGASNDLESEAAIYGIYQGMKNDELKDFLRWNLGYGMSTTKPELLLRCIDGHKNGRFARCPTCFEGKLQLNSGDAGGTVVCSGYFDEEAGARIPCSYTVKNNDAPRLHPWYAEQPSEEEVEEMKKITEGAKAGASGGGASDNVDAALAKLAKKLEWPDTSSMQGKKQAAKMMLGICTTVDLPQDEKKAFMAIGSIITANPTEAKSATDILNLVVEKFGFAKKKAAVAEAQKKSIETSCANPANAAVMQAFLEISNLYYKEKNTNAGNSYKKAANAIMNLTFEITEENAKGLGKGKTKIASVGKGSADKMFEFVSTGTIAKLEEKRAAAA